MLFAPPQLPRTLAAALRDAIDKSPEVRRSALRDLTRHHQGGDEGGADEVRGQVETALLEALEDESPAVRGEAAEQLGACRVGAALPALLAAIEDPHVVVRQMAIAARAGQERRVARKTGPDRDLVDPCSECPARVSKIYLFSWVQGTSLTRAV